MFPEEFTERLRSQKYIDADELVAALSAPSPVSVRLNPYKWHHLPGNFERVPWENDGIYLDRRPVFTLDPLFHAGVYYPQEASSMFAGEAFRQVAGTRDNLRILDLCGAPGGKTTHISSIAGGKSLIVANEVIRARAAVLAENVTKWGLGNTIVTQNDPSDLASLGEFFDVIIADAPCSGEGMFRNPVAVREWSVANARLCSERQRRIVIDAWPSLKPGGVLLYSTCTFNPAENEENIAWLANTAGAESLQLDTGRYPGIRTIEQGGITGYGFHPGKVAGEGFFIAAVVKNESEGSPAVRNRREREQRLTASVADLAESLICGSRENLSFENDRIVLLATDRSTFGNLAQHLKIIKSGTAIGEFRGRDFIPAHDLAMSVNARGEAWPALELDYDRAVSYLKLESFPAGELPAGRILVTFRNVPLGFINSIGNRFNNAYPQAWRIRMERQSGQAGFL